MLYKKLWGEESQVPATGFREARVYKAAPKSGQVYAEIVGLRESHVSVRPVITDGNGVAMRRIEIEIAYTGSGIQGEAESRDIGQNLSPYTRAKCFAAGDAENGIPLYGGSKIGPGGPADWLLVVGRYDTLPIVSDVLATGLYSSDVAASPVFRLRYID